MPEGGNRAASLASRRAHRVILIAIGAVVVLVSLFADELGLDSSPEFGRG